MKQNHPILYRLQTAGRMVASWPWARIGLITLCAFLAIVFTLLITATVYVEYLLSQIRRPSLNGQLPTTEYVPPELPDDFDGEIINPDDVDKPENLATIIAHKDIVNIMLVGQDRREDENYLTRSDAMILCTFNKQSKKITLTSFMRDLYVQIPGYGGNKMNAAYPLGGMPLLKSTMMENFGIQIDGFIEVDLSGFSKIIDMIGGVTIEVTQQESDYIYETYELYIPPGVNHLNGEEALIYSRIRAFGNGDYDRTERQRRVIMAIINSCKGSSFSELHTLLMSVLPLIATDMSNEQIMNLATNLFPLLSGGSLSQQRIPIDGSYYDTGPNAIGTIPYCLVPDYEKNHQFLVDTLMPKS